MLISPARARNRWLTSTLPVLTARTRATAIWLEWTCSVTDQTSPDRVTVGALRTSTNGGAGAAAPQRPRQTRHCSSAVPSRTWKLYRPGGRTVNGPILAGPAAARSVTRGPTLPARSPITRAIPARDVLKRSVTRKPVAVWRTIGGPRDLRTAPAPPPPLPVDARKVAMTDRASFRVKVQVGLLPALEHELPQP